MNICVFSSDVCRLCLWKANELLAIFGPPAEGLSVAQKIRTILPFRVSREDPFPKGVCSSCVYKLEMFFEFYNTCAVSNDKLRRYLPASSNHPILFADEAEEEVKQEVLEDPIAISCEDFQHSFTDSDLGNVSYEQSASTNDFGTHSDFQHEHASQERFVREDPVCFQDGQALQDVPGMESYSSMVSDEPTLPLASASESHDSIVYPKAQASNVAVKVKNAKMGKMKGILSRSSPKSHTSGNNLPEKKDISINPLPETRTSDIDAVVTSSSLKEVDTDAVNTRLKGGSYNLSCNHCSLKFKTRALLHLHFCNPPRNNLLSCRYCDKVFKNRYHLSMHKKVHISRASYSCKECRKKFDTMKAFRKHRNADCRTVKVVSLDHMYSSRNGSILFCNLCRRSFSTAGSFGKHLKCKQHRQKVMQNRFRSRKRPKNFLQTKTSVKMGKGKKRGKPLKLNTENVRENCQMRFDEDEAPVENDNSYNNDIDDRMIAPEETLT